jgi:glycosyltransferase involved in cell wall biosynthesis
VQQPTLAIFANFRIDSEERLQRMKDSFLSFKTITAQKWLINIRGEHKLEARIFLKEQLGPRLILFQLESPEGWFHDSQTMLHHIDSDFVLYWIEDHINLIDDCSIYNTLIMDMSSSHVEFLPYSFFWVKDRYRGIQQYEMNSLNWLDLDEQSFRVLQKTAPKAYIIFALGIFTLDLFNRIITTDDYCQTIKWPIETPFNFEKSWHDVHWLPIRVGLPKQELFASIDDDSVVPGSSLISRGLYMQRQSRTTMGTSESYRPINEVTFSSLTRQRNTRELIDRLQGSHIAVMEINLDYNDFSLWLREHRKIYDHYSTMNDVIIEKCLEHYIAYTFTEPKPGQVYIDIAAAGSNWADLLMKRGVNAYCLDLQYQQGIHGNKIGANAVDTKLPDNSVDAMSLQCAFETFRADDDKSFMREAKRILKNGGRVVISPLYLDMQHFILSGKNANLVHAPLDEGAIRVWREDDYDEDFSRHYSPEAFAARILPNLDGLTAEVLYIKNLDEFRARFPGQRIYCDFNVIISKQVDRSVSDETTDLHRIYNDEFYNEQKDASYKSAESIVPILMDVFHPRSVADIGCGAGGWLHVFNKSGVNTITGYDVNELAAEKYFIDKNNIKTNTDFSGDNFAIQNSADLLTCLEVAEHLPNEAADSFIRKITSASPVIIFSTALPGQTGVNHINEQPPWYWREKFNSFGFFEIDFIRPQILRDENICWWYRQNITCFVRSDALSANPKLAELAKTHGQKDSGHKLTVVNEWVLKHILAGEYSNACSTKLQNELPFLSVVIPTRNRAALLYNALESITKQTYSTTRFEVIIVDNGSTDATAEVCQHFKQRIPNLKYISVPLPGLHNGRHAGLKESIGEILIYADDDIEALPTWLEGVAESFSDPQVALVGGKILPKFESQPPEWFIALSKTTDSGWSLGWYSILDFGDTEHEIPHEYVWGCNFSIRKNVLQQVGGFHPDSFPQEFIKYRGDGETAVSQAIRNLGLKAFYNPKASVYHVVTQNRLTQEYIYQRAHNQGISDSYTSIRTARLFSEDMQYKSPTNTIHDVVDRGYVDGFNYHQQLAKSDETLLNWILKESYINCEDVSL